MTGTFRCGSCNTLLRPPSSPGKPVRCPRCGKVGVVGPVPLGETLTQPTRQAEGPKVTPTPAASQMATLPPGERTEAVTLGAGPAVEEPASRPHPPGYEILDELGRGGMGVVYKARQVKLNRVVALKMILAGGHASEGERERFRIEAEAVARLSHPGIVQVYEVGEHEGRPFFSLEFCAGGSLDRKLAGKPLPARDAAALVRALAKAMQSAHEANVIHRDLKPGNVLLVPPHPPTPSPTKGERGSKSAPAPPSAPQVGEGGWGGEGATPKITDFGLAKQLDSASGATRTGAVLGTPSYMAPEQAEGRKDVGPAADIYSLGAILYECLTGRPPFVAASPLDTMMQVVSAEPVPPTRLNGALPRDLETIALKCLQKQPARRYASAGDLADDLGRYLEGLPIHARPVGAAGRLVRWCRRRPVVAALLGSVLLLLAAVAGVASAGYVSTSRALSREEAQRREADRLRQEAESERNEAQTQRVEAERQTGVALRAEKELREEARRIRRLLYVSNVQQAAQAWAADEGLARLANDLLLSDIPRPGEEDLRDFAWRYQWGLMYGGPGALRGHQTVQQLAFLPDGALVSLDGDGVVRRWDPAEGKLLARVALRKPGERGRLALSADGRFAAAVEQRKVTLWDVTTGKVLHTLGVAGGTSHLRFLPDGRSLLVRRPDETLQLWDTQTGKRKEVVKGSVGTDFAPQQPFSPDGSAVLVWHGVGHFGLQLTDWRKRSSRASTRVSWSLSSAAFSPDGSRVATGDQHGDIILRDPRTLKETSRLSNVHFGGVTSLCFSPDGKLLATGGRDARVTVWDLEKQQRSFLGKGHTQKVTALTFSPDGKALASADRNVVRVWSLGGAPEKPRFQPIDRPLYHLSVSSDGLWLASSHLGKVLLWDVKTGALARTLVNPQPGQKGATFCSAFSPDGKLLAAAAGPGKVCLWEASSGKVVKTLSFPPPGKDEVTRGIACLAFSPDGTYLVAGLGTPALQAPNHAQLARVWDLRSGALVAALPHNNSIAALAFSPDGQTLATGGADAHVRLWSVGGWKEERTLSTQSRVESLAWSADGVLTAGELEGTIQQWDAKTGKAQATLRGHTLGVKGLVFTPDGKTLASASADRSVLLWYRPANRVIARLAGHGEAVRGLALTPDGTTLLSGDEKAIRAWSAPGWKEIEAGQAEPEPDDLPEEID